MFTIFRHGKREITLDCKPFSFITTTMCYNMLFFHCMFVSFLCYDMLFVHFMFVSFLCYDMLFFHYHVCIISILWYVIFPLPCLYHFYVMICYLFISCLYHFYVMICYFFITCLYHFYVMICYLFISCLYHFYFLCFILLLFPSNRVLCVLSFVLCLVYQCCQFLWIIHFYCSFGIL